MAEEQPCQAPEGHRLCTNNCGFLGSPATMNLCSKCYGEIRIKEQQDASTKSTIENALSSSSSSSSSSSAVASLLSPSVSTSETPIVVSVKSINPTQTSTEIIASSSVTVGLIQPTVQLNRCVTCRKRVGLTGFKCRCGSMFCGSHRYPERHGCSFDFKTVGREEIARANPLIRAEKLQRI